MRMFSTVNKCFVYKYQPSLVMMINLEGLINFPSRVHATVAGDSADSWHCRCKRSPSRTLTSLNFCMKPNVFSSPALFISLFPLCKQSGSFSFPVQPSLLFSRLIRFFFLFNTDRKSAASFLQVSGLARVFGATVPFFPNTALKSTCCE